MMSAIRTGRIHQAYLMTGSRGIGKTSIARIFAKAVRCPNIKTVDEWIVTCDHCPSCIEITASKNVDVIEIDGASNNGVDAVREIRENTRFLPSSGERKIYIIDEVHMLSISAFNALLKTLEEPPPHVIFIFATTEPNKIPATILSRIQKFDLKRISVSQIRARLDLIAQAENLTVDVGALTLIARAAEGSMRDALSFLDQIIAYSGNQISLQSAQESLGLVESKVFNEIISAVLRRKPHEALALVDECFVQGHDLKVVARGLIECLYGTILAKIGSAVPQSYEVSSESWEQIQELSKLRTLEELELIFQVIHQSMNWIDHSPHIKLVLDVVLIKCATAEGLVYIDQPFAAPAPASTPRQTSAQQPVEPLIKSTVMITKPTVTANSATLPTWEGLIAHIKVSRPLLATVLEHGAAELPGSGREYELSIFFKPDDAYYKDQLQSRVYSEQLTSLCSDYFGKSIRIRTELRAGGESLAAKRDRERTERESFAQRSAHNHPIITEARSLFGGELGSIEIIEEDHVI
jgi:DNA polymerase-3 subunit gamma/tau